MEKDQFLFLLPIIEIPVDAKALSDAFGSLFYSIYRRLKTHVQTGKPLILDIALACSHLDDHGTPSRAATYEETQLLVSGIYKLICVAAANELDSIEATDDIDPRVVLLAYSPESRSNIGSESGPKRSTDDGFGPVIDLDKFAKCKRDWQTIFSIKNEEGEDLLKSFLQSLPAPPKVERLSTGGTLTKRSNTNYQSNKTTNQRIHSVAVGGTFDHLHIGHKLLLTMTAFVLDQQRTSNEDSVERSITIGITGDELLKNKKYAEQLESWSRRQERAHEFLNSIIDFRPSPDTVKTEEKHGPGPNGHAVHVTLSKGLQLKYVEIWDPFGPTITDETISALVVSEETKSGGKAVNDKRIEKDWDPLKVFEVSVLDSLEGDQPIGQDGADAFKSKISSTEIRRAYSERET